MSPPSLRRYRAERLLREEFELQRARVLASVYARLRAAGIRLDEGDLDACYALAWHGLYAALLEGQDVASPTGWLALVTYRRAIDEHRARRRAQGPGHGAGCKAPPADEPGAEARAEQLAGRLGDGDFAAEMDDRTRLRHLFEGLRARLGSRELQAAELCYLHGLSRSDAARAMGVSERRMRKLMEGRGPGRPGVSRKVNALVQSIREGAWCEEQASLMRGFAYGMLDHGGERYRLARSHLDSCPSCRAYVASLRGLAALLPPPLLPLVRWASGASGAGAGPASVLGPLHGAALGRGGALANSAPAGPAATLPASAGASAGAASGGWLLAGGPAAKLAVGCVLALGVGAGCVSLTRQPGAVRHLRRAAIHRSADLSAHAASLQLGAKRTRAPAPTSPRGSAGAAPTPHTNLPASRMATREFGPEQALAGSSHAPAAAPVPSQPRATAASVGRLQGGASTSTEFSSAGPSAGSASSGGYSQPAGAHDAASAQREFAPG